MFGYIQMLCFIFISGTILFGVYNILLYHKQKVNEFCDLSIYYINILLVIQSSYTLFTRITWPDIVFYNVGTPFKLLYGPLFLFLIRSTIYKRILFDPKNYKMYFHFIPFVFFGSWYIYLLSIGETSLEDTSGYLLWLYAFSGIQMMVYCILSLYIMQTYNIVKTDKRVKRLYFDGLLILILRSIYLIGDALSNDLDIRGSNLGSLFLYLAMFIISILIHKLWIKDYFFRVPKENPPHLDKRVVEKIKNRFFKNKSIKEKYSQSRGDIKALKEYGQKIEALSMDVFLDRDLNIEKLASILHINTHTLSQTFSLVLKSSYSSFVHKKRIEHTVKILKDQPQITITEVSEESGFNSLASFYRAFKEIHNITPREYQKNSLKN